MNVLFIIVDDLRPELGCYGSTIVKSPHIDKLAHESLVFDRAYCQAPICSPSRMSFLSGLRPNETTIHDNNTPLRQTIADIITLPQHFKNHGYQARAFGKVFHQGIGDSLSWDFYDDGPKHRSVYQLYENTEINDVKDGSKRGRPYEAAEVADDYYTDGIILNRALDALDSFDTDRPFFLAIGFLKPHLPFLAPKKYWDLYDNPRANYSRYDEPPIGAPHFAMNNAGELRNYYGVPEEGQIPEALGDTLFHGYMACISYMDAQIGKLLAKLEELHIKENTVIVLVGDHGYKLGDFNDWCKDTHYEFDTRVPLIIHHPHMTSGRTSSLVELVDLYPTLTDATSLPDPEQKMSGKSLMQIFENNSLSVKSAAYSQRPRGILMGFSIRTDRFRLVKWVHQSDYSTVDFIELYDYHEDPVESLNVADSASYLSVREAMLQQLKAEIGV
ncbi:MAG: sulfatase [Cyclobacteriaceae bacterium]|nr:sulfatase [Cyclobacteriaceae bacterium]